MGKFKKGDPKPPNSGIKKGQISEKKKAWEELGQYILNEGVDRYMEILATLPNEKFLDRFESILEYFKPKQTRQTVINEGEKKEINIPIIHWIDSKPLPENDSNQ